MKGLYVSRPSGKNLGSQRWWPFSVDLPGEERLERASQIYHIGTPPNLRRNRSACGRRQHEEVVAISIMAVKLCTFSKLTRPGIVANFVFRHHQRQSSQARVQLFMPDPKRATVVAENQTDLSALVDEMFDERCRLNHTTLKANAKIFSVDISGQSGVQHNRDATLVLGSELANCQPARPSRSFPIDIAQFVTRLIITQHQQIVARAPAK